MRTLLTLIVPSVVLAALAAWLVVRCPRNAAGCCGGEDSACGTVAQLDRTLDLTPDQQMSTASELETYQHELAACDARLAETRQRLSLQLFKPGVADDMLQAMADELGRIQRESDLATLRHMRRMHSLLSPSQQARYEAWITPCICGSKPAGHQPCSCNPTHRP